MAEAMIKPSIRVLTYAGVGQVIEDLARRIRSEVIQAMAAVDPDRVVGTIQFDEPVTDVDGLARRLTDGRDTILHLVSHADALGAVSIKDIWGNLRLAPETLARMAKGNGIKVIMVSACWGAEIAKALVYARAVGAAVGHTELLSTGAAVQMSCGFYRSLIQGKSPRQAAEDGYIFAKPRLLRGGGKGELKIWSRRRNYPDDPLFGPQFHIIGTPITGCDDAVDQLTEHLRPYAVSHISMADFGDGTAEMEWSLRNARVIIVLADDEPVAGIASAYERELLEEIGAAVERARSGEVRVVPTFLAEETTPLPLGLKRLARLFLHRDFGGSYQKLAEALKRALERDLKRR